MEQITVVNDLNPRSIIEIGVGPGAKRSMVEAAYPGCQYKTVDIDPALRPDVCADVRNLPFGDDHADISFCCQVLEHLPYEFFIQNLMELRRVTRRRVVISLPDVRPFFYLRARFGFRHAFPWLWNGLSLSHPFTRTHHFEDHGQHHWEIGKRGYGLNRIIADIHQLPWTRVRHYRLIDRWYWHFFILDILE